MRQTALFAALRQLALDGIEAQAAGDGIGFGEPHLDLVAKGEALPRPPPDETVARFVVFVVVAGEAAHWDETVGAGLGQAHEEAGARHAADPRLKAGADAIGQKSRDIAIGGVALGRGSAPLGHRYLLAQIREVLARDWLVARTRKVERGDQ